MRDGVWMSGRCDRKRGLLSDGACPPQEPAPALLTHTKSSLMGDAQELTCK